MAIPEKFYSAIVLDSLGYRNQILGSGIQAMTSAARFRGKIRTARAVTVDSIPGNGDERERRGRKHGPGRAGRSGSRVGGLQ